MIKRFKYEFRLLLFAISRKVLFCSIFLVYPITFMVPVLNPSSRTRLGHGFSDMNGTILLAQQLKSMRFPWSQNSWLGYPNESIFWTFTKFSQSIHWVVLYFLTRLFSPYFSVNLAILAGWTLTGLLAYFVAREVGINKLVSIFVGLATQSLPWMREKAEEHLSYVYIAVPLLVVLCILRFAKIPSCKNGFLLSSSLAFAFVFDLYWFFFSFYMVIACLLVIYAKHFFVLRISIQLTLITAVIATVALAYKTTNWMLVLANKSNASFSSRTLGVPDWQFVFDYSGLLTDFLIRDQSNSSFASSFELGRGSDNIFYIGISLLVLSLFGFAHLIKKLNSGISKVLISSFVFTLLLSLRTIDLGFFSIPAVNQFLKFIMPGARVFLRSGLIAEALLVCVAGLGLQQILAKIDRSSYKVLFTFAVALIVIIDLQPFANRNLYDDGERIEEQSRFMSSAETGALLNAHPEVFRTAEFLDQPMYNTPSNLWMVLLYPHAAKGSSTLATYLNDIGVGFVVAPVNQRGEPQISGWLQDSAFFTTILNPNDFISVGDDFTNGDSGLVNLRLLQVRTGRQNIQHSCVDCSLALADISPQLLVEGSEPGYQQQITLWAAEAAVSISPREIDLVPAERFRIRITFISAGGAAATPQTVRFHVGEKNGDFELSPSFGKTVDFWIPKGETLLLEATRPCFVPSEQIEGNIDNRRFCWGISSMLIEAVR